MYAARRAHLPKYGKPRPAMEPDPSAGAPRPNAATTLADDFDNARKAAASQFHFKFSLAQLLIVLTTAAVLLGLIRIFGGPGQTLVIRHNSLNEESFMPGLLLAIRRVGTLEGLAYGLEHLLGLR